MFLCANRVLVLGAGGLLGADLVPILKASGFEVLTHGRSSGDYQFDLDSCSLVNEMLKKINPDVIVNLVALTDVDRCEKEPNQAYIGNVRSIVNVADWVKRRNEQCQLIHISTDQVYDGMGLHTEENVTLTNYYAFSKYAGELAALNVGATVLRTNFFGRSHCDKRSSFTDWLFGALLRKENIQVFDDVQFSPLSMNTLSKMIASVIRKKVSGVFNLGSHNGLSKADFAFAFADELSLPSAAMNRTTTEKVTFLKTYRPKDMRMDCALFERVMGVKLPDLKDEIKKVAMGYL